MRARLVQSLATDHRAYQPGDLVDGNLASRFVRDGVAVPLIELQKVEKAVRKRPVKEDRYFDLRKD